MPASATPKGTPTAQPTMTAVFDFFSVVCEGPVVTDGAGTWVTTVDTMVVRPALPEETVLMTDVVGVDEGASVVESLSPEVEVMPEDDSSDVDDVSDDGDDGGFDGGFDDGFDDESSLVDDEPLPPPVASMVMDARLGALVAVDRPMVA